MSKLSKNNSIYYKVQLSKLVKQAKKNGLEVYLQENHVCFRNGIGETTCMAIGKIGAK